MKCFPSKNRNKAAIPTPDTFIKLCIGGIITYVNLFTDGMIYSVENSEVSKKSRFLDCISKFSKAFHELHNSQHNFEKGEKKEFLRYLISRLQISKQCCIGTNLDQ